MNTQLQKTNRRRQARWLSCLFTMMLAAWSSGVYAQALSLTGSQTDVTCFGANDGTATVTANAGTPPYTYLWAPGGQTTQTAVGLSGATYTVTVTDNLGATDVMVFTINEPTSLAASSGGQTNVSCNGGSNGSATVSVSGGTPGYTYSWAPFGGTAATASGLVAGNYTVTVTDANLCSTTQVFNITEPTALALTPSQTDETPCNISDNGTASVSVSGGTPGYTYSWSHGPTTSSVTGLTAGNYTVTVTDANSCTATQSFAITEPTQIVGAPSQTNVSCNGGSNGSATVIASGGGSPFYAYSWSPVGGTGTTASGLSAGNYTVTISNGLGCSGTQTFTITQPTALSTTGSQTNVLCNGGNTGTATVVASGGAGFYSYAWSPTGGTGSTASGLTAQTYTVLVTDFNFCTTTHTYNITQPSALATTGSQTNVSCFGGSNGTATVTPSGGTPGYTYSWAPTGGTAATATGLAAGNYTVTVTDANLCTTTRTYNITVPGSAISTTGSQTNVLCNGASTGSATVVASGGTPGYTYSWAPSGGTAATASGLAAGMYTVTVTDANSCTATRTYNITQSTAIATTGSQTNVLCNGASTGSASVTPTGGTSPYTYSWAPSGGTASTASGLAAGNYTVTVTDANSCTATHTYAITQPTAIASTGSQTNVACNGGTTGSATVTASGGTPGYTYSWAPSGGTAATASGLAAGNYTVTVTDANSCTHTRTFAITQPTALATTGSQTNVSCNGGANGTATVIVSGGTPGYTYSWAPSGGSAATATGLTAGNYTVTATDANSCTITRTFAITQPTALASTGSSTNVSCNGGSNGTATISVTGGTPGYSYSWAPSGGIGNTATGLSAGNYTVTVTDANGCTHTRTYAITAPAALATTGSQTNVSCFGGSNGTATVVASGGTTPYTYSWAPSGGTAATATGLATGNYTVTVTDANTCTTTHTYAITQPAAPLSSTGTQTNVTCFGGTDGTAAVTVAGGTTPYSYSWAPSGGTAASASSLAAGNYTVTVTDANSCTHTRTFAITQPTQITATGSQTNVSCFGGSNGTATVVASGGSSPFYSYSWSPSGGTGTTASGLTAGNYTCTITNPFGCTGTRTFTITQPTALSTTGSQTNASCNGGSNGTATVVVSGGTPGYTYAWAPTGGVAATATGLAAGNYTVTATDANGCTITRTYNITQPSAITSTGTQTNVSCFGGANGSATVTASGGTGAYTYSWAPSGGTAATATGLSFGVYTVTVTDANSCTHTRTFNITQPTILSTTGTQTNVSCNGGSNGTATVSVSGGTPGYTYSWAPSGGTAATATGLAVGNYTVTVTDANSCTTTRTYAITQPSAITTTGTQVNVSCNGGSNGTATVLATGGTGAYTYSWAPSGGTAATKAAGPAGTYTVTVTDANLCTATRTFNITQPTAITSTGSQTAVSCFGGANATATVTASGGTTPYTYSWAPSGGTAATATGLAAGNYTVTVTDANACTHTRTYTITQPTVIASTGSQTNVSCNGGSNGTATVTASGGTPGYTYSWAPSGGTAATATGLAAGVYTVTVTDANLCTHTRTYSITQPTALATTGTQNNVTCFGGSNGNATVSVTGGTPGYTYSWAPSGGTAATKANGPIGTYTVTVTDANLCTTTRTFAITQPSQITSVGTQVNVACNGQANGSATVVATGGTGAFTYSWAPSGGTAATATGLTAGNYTVTVTDANSCTHTRTYNITQPNVLLTNGTSTNVTCFGFANGTITTAVTGGTAPYSYLWSPGGQTSSSLSNLAPSTHTVTVTDVNGCTATQSFNITEPTLLVSSASQVDVLCNGNNTGSATITVSGGTTPYAYSWAPTGGTGSTESNLVAGTYTATVTDANGCVTSQTYTITEPTALVSVDNQSNVLCNGQANGTASVSVSGGVPGYTYNWAPYGGTGATATGLTAGTYTVTITDANACVLVRTFNITQPATLISAASWVNVTCNGLGNGTATITALGGTTPYSYVWSPYGGNAATATGLVPGIYTADVTDANGCTTSQTYAITEPPVLTVAGTQTNVTCNGFGNGTATVTAAGGTQPYSYNWAPYGGTAATATNLTAGTYTATVIDNNNCTYAYTFNITQPNTLTSTIVAANVSCNGGSNGTATVNATGGTAPYTYNWMPSGGTAATATGLAAGTYTATVTDANGCSYSNTVVINQPTTLVALAANTTPVCSGDSMAVIGTAYGGTAPYNYAWTGPVAAAVPVISLPNSTTAYSGTYNLTVTDANGCVATDATTAVVNQTPTVTTQPVAATACVGTSASFSVTAIGTGISYQWRANGVNLSNTGVYSGAFTNTLSISDVTGLNGTMYDVVVSGVCYPDTSISVMLTAPTFNSWTGTVDTAWSNAANWQCGVVPTIYTDVIIPSSAPKMPLVNIPTAVANSVTVNSGATLGYVGTGSQLEIKADLTNLGTFNATNGALMLSGTGAQSIPGVTYSELELNGGGTKTTTGNLTVTNSLVLTEGYLQLGTSNLTLAPTAVVTGGDATSFVITNGTGVVIAQGLGTGGNTGTVTFPVGTTAGIYTPAALANIGTMDNFSVRVIENVYNDYNNEAPVGFPISAFSVKKTWMINEAVDGGSNATVSLSWPLSEELGGFNNSLCNVAHYNETSLNWDLYTDGPVTGTVVLFTRARAGVTTFSPFGLSSASGPLSNNAITLAGVYNAYAKTVDLSWDRSTDEDVVKYSLERSVDGSNYTAITSKDAGDQFYEFTDAEAGNLNAKQLYYRLQVVSNDNSYVYTNTVKVDLAGSVVTYGLTLYPNPVSGSEVFVSISDNALATDMDIVVCDVMGKEVIKRHYDAGTYNPNAIQVNVDALAQGMYTLRLKQAGAMMQTVKFTRK